MQSTMKKARFSEQPRPARLPGPQNPKTQDARRERQDGKDSSPQQRYRPPNKFKPPNQIGQAPTRAYVTFVDDNYQAEDLMDLDAPDEGALLDERSATPEEALPSPYQKDQSSLLIPSLMCPTCSFVDRIPSLCWLAQSANAAACSMRFILPPRGCDEFVQGNEVPILGMAMTCIFNCRLQVSKRIVYL
jgi:hypothetical protein